jgi:hypothetical protein
MRDEVQFEVGEEVRVGCEGSISGNSSFILFFIALLHLRPDKV